MNTRPAQSTLPDAPPPAPWEDSLDQDIDDDDRPVGRFLSRREVLALFGASGAAVAIAACMPGAGASDDAGASTAAGSTDPAGSLVAPASGSTGGAIPSCVVIPELTEGPYYVDGIAERSDIRTDSAGGAAVDGAALELGWVVSRVEGDACTPLEGVLVDVWHCDGEGRYSGVQGLEGSDFLRGYQRTDANGATSFTTIYPGWYQGRAVHIHFKIRTDPDADTGFEATSQLFFDDAFSAEVFQSGIYAAKGAPDTPNESDGIFAQSGGTTLLDVTQDGDTYRTTFSIAVQIV